MTVFDPRDWGKVDYIVTQNVIRFVNQCSNTAKTLNLALPSNHLSPVRKEATLRHCSPLEAISQKLKTGLQKTPPSTASVFAALKDFTSLVECRPESTVISRGFANCPQKGLF